jgi:hypothetical protein
MRWFHSSSILLSTACAALAAGGPLAFRTRELPRAALGADYRVTIQTQVDGRCPSSDARLSLEAGSLPRGLELRGEWLTGVPKELGVFRFRLRGATDCTAARQDYVLEVTGRPILRATPENLVFDYRVGDPQPEPQTVLLSSTWPELPYAVSTTAAWLRAVPEQGVTPDAGAALGADRVSVHVLAADLAPGVYEGRLVFMAHQSAASPAIRVTLRVIAPNR